jgi:hypothetical protein
MPRSAANWPSTRHRCPVGSHATVTPANPSRWPVVRPSPTQSRGPRPGSGTSAGPAPSSRDHTPPPSAYAPPGRSPRSRSQPAPALATSSRAMHLGHYTLDHAPLPPARVASLLCLPVRHPCVLAPWSADVPMSLLQPVVEPPASMFSDTASGHGLRPTASSVRGTWRSSSTEVYAHSSAVYRVRTAMHSSRSR